LSLDVVLGGACGLLLAEDVTGTRVPGAVWIALPLAIWVVYTADHLLDARRFGRRVFSYRHRFHARHRRVLSRAVLAAGAAGLAVALVGLPSRLALGGLGLAGAIAVYLAAAQRLERWPLPKEPLTAALYAAGIWFAPLLLSTQTTRWTGRALALHALAAALNLMAFGVFEARVDERQGSASLARTIGLPTARRLILALSGAGLALALHSGAVGPPALRPDFAVLGALVAFPAAMLLGSAYFARSGRYRIFGDLVFTLAALPRLLE